MKNKIKMIDLLIKIANGEELPKKIKYEDEIFTLNEIILENSKKYIDYYSPGGSWLLFADIINVHLHLNDEVEILDEEDKDIPLIPDDELNELDKRDFIPLDKAIDYNFKVLKEKINQVVEELNKRQ